MAPIDDAIAAIESLEPGEHYSYREVARRFNVSNSTLTRRHKGRRQRSQEAKNNTQLALNPQQEAELVRYIEDFTKRALPPTRDMIRNFASHFNPDGVSDTWVDRFISRNGNHLICKWTSGIDSQRHNANSRAKYKLYFDHLHSKMLRYEIQPHNTYNMNEKGFMIGVTTRPKRVFSRRQWERKEVRAALQDGSREWVTLLATVCADGTALPPGIIYQSDNSTLQAPWVAEINTQKHNCFISSSLSGWTNNELGLAWLEQVFERCTKQKARLGRDWRLLILDGHGSHLTFEFLEYCEAHRILVSVFPPHSTHTLQPLDVVCFKPLSRAYTHQLTRYLHRTQGLVPLKKGDFFPLFWAAWSSSITEKLVHKGFEATGIWPKDPDVILKQFDSKEQEEAAEASHLTNRDWRHMERLVRAAVSDRTAEELKKLSETLHSLAVQNELLYDENDGLPEALDNKKKRKDRSKCLDLQREDLYHGGATFWSPHKIRQAWARELEKQQQEEAEIAARANRKEL
jgi:transposase-like protein